MQTVVTASSGLLDPVTLIGHFGTWALVGLLAVVFVEAGVIFPLLPGDTLLFLSGMIAAGSETLSRKDLGHGDFRIWQLVVLVPVAAFLGAQIGYLIGRVIGTSMFKPNARLLKERYLNGAHAFFEDRGPSAIVITRFVPIIRTLIPLAAGAAKMNRMVFTMFNAVGSVAWGAGLPLLGYGLGQFAIVQRLLEPLFVLVGVASVAPMLVEWFKRRRSATGPSGRLHEPTSGCTDGGD